jgi:ClpP class serine protease
MSEYMSLLWLLLIVVAVQPLIQQRLLAATRRRLRIAMETERSSRVILLVHREERMSLLGIPFMRYIDIQDSEEVVRAIHHTRPDQPIDLILHTPGGLALASLQIARALARHPAQVTAFVPHYAMSGGTLLALAADEIVMSHHAVLGPVDPLVGPYPAASILRAVARKEPKDIDDETLILADQAEMAIRQLRQALCDLLVERLGEEQAIAVASALSEGHWTHDFPVTPEMASTLGLKVSETMPEIVVEMMSLYPQPVRRMRSVEYDRKPPLPVPERRPPEAPM